MVRAVYVGQLWEGGTCLERAKVLEKRGWEILQFDVSPYLSRGSRLRRSLQSRMLYGPDVVRLNRDLIDFVRTKGAVDLIWIDKGRTVFSDTLQALKNTTGALLVHYTPDPAFTVHTSRHFVKGIKLYDLCVTTKKYELKAYEEAGAKSVVFNWQGVDQRFIECDSCAQLEGDDRSGIVFVGHRERYYERQLKNLAAQDLGLKIWGPGWEKLKGKADVLGSSVQGGGVWKDEYPRTLAKGKLGIGLLSKMYPDAFTTRSFEVPAAGAMLLAERTEDHELLFEEGSEAEFFSTPEELIEKSKYYLANDSERIEIARRGREKVLRSYTWGKVMMPTLDIVTQILGGC